MSEGGGYESVGEGVRALVAGSVTYEWILDHLEVAGGGEWPYSRQAGLGAEPPVSCACPRARGVDVRVVDASVGELYGEIGRGR